MIRVMIFIMGFYIPAVFAEFDSPVDIANGSISGVSALDACDFTGNGLLDVAVFEGGLHANGRITYHWIEQKSDGTWLRHSFGGTSGLDDFIGAAQCADIDNDGDNDVVFTNDGHSDGPIKIFLLENPGTGSVRNYWERHELNSTLGEHANDLRIGHMDRDNYLDIVFRHKEPHDLIILFQNSKTSWTKKQIGNKNGEGLSIGDLNNDNRLDISISGEWYQSPSNPRTDNWSKHTYAHYSNIATKEAIGDIDGDGLNDIVLSPAESFNYYGTPGDIHALTWYKQPASNPGGGIWSKKEIRNNINDYHSAWLADIDGINGLDIVTAKNFSGSDNEIVIHYNDGNGDFVGPYKVASGRGLYSGAVKDIDADGDVDIVGENDYSKSSQPYFYKNNLTTLLAKPKPPSGLTVGQ